MSTNPPPRLIVDFPFTSGNLRELKAMFESERARAVAFVDRWSQYGVAVFADPETLEATLAYLQGRGANMLRARVLTSPPTASLELTHWEHTHPLATSPYADRIFEPDKLLAWLNLGWLKNPTALVIDPHALSGHKRLTKAVQMLVGAGVKQVEVHCLLQHLGSKPDSPDGLERYTARLAKRFHFGEPRWDRAAGATRSVTLQPASSEARLRRLTIHAYGPLAAPNAAVGAKPRGVRFHDRFVEFRENQENIGIGATLGYGLLEMLGNRHEIPSVAVRLPSEFVESQLKNIQRDAR